ncbi:MAG: hypothetical protein LAN71_04085 [Acidobacteriia bacterium]|nr:hypothetical protein [Terriglobia bacterium]
MFCFVTDADLMGELGTGLSDEEIAAKLGELWKVFGDEALKIFIVEHPGERPSTWWRCSSPEPRPEIDWRGGSPGGDPYAADRALKRAQEIDILFRHQLLTAAERRLLAEEDPAHMGFLGGEKE